MESYLNYFLYFITLFLIVFLPYWPFICPKLIPKLCVFSTLLIHILVHEKACKGYYCTMYICFSSTFFVGSGGRLVRFVLLWTAGLGSNPSAAREARNSQSDHNELYTYDPISIGLSIGYGLALLSVLALEFEQEGLLLCLRQT